MRHSPIRLMGDAASKTQAEQLAERSLPLMRLANIVAILDKQRRDALRENQIATSVGRLRIKQSAALQKKLSDARGLFRDLAR